MSTPRYTDQFLNALMDSHGMTLRCELWRGGSLVGPLNTVSGSVSCDRSATVRRTANITVDPGSYTDTVIGPMLNPYGSIVKVWRGVRYPDGSIENAPIFTGRIDSVDVALDGVSLHCSDMASMVVDSRFPDRYQVSNATTLVTDLIKTLIQGALPTASVVVETTSAALVRNGTAWETERGDALNELAAQIGAEWFADVEGVFRVRTLPAVITDTTPVEWIIDAGDQGVMITHGVTTDRVNVYNHVVVNGEPINGVKWAKGEWKDNNPLSPTYYDGPYGHIPIIYTNQTLSPNDDIAAGKLAAQYGYQSISKTSSLSVQCVANAKLQLASVVRAYAPKIGIDGLYYVQAMELPCAPEDSMSITLNQTIETTSTSWRYAQPRNPVGAVWQPGM